MKTLLLCLTFLTIGLSLSSQSDYSTALGARVGWGIALSGKQFISESHALELIVQYRPFWSQNYHWTMIRGLYQIHESLHDVTQGLQWYYGGGAYLGRYGGTHFTNTTYARSFFGLSLNIGLDFKVPDIPLNLSVDWMPSFNVNGFNSGLYVTNGNLAIRYTLK